jgi:hypothetical protein
MKASSYRLPANVRMPIYQQDNFRKYNSKCRRYIMSSLRSENEVKWGISKVRIVGRVKIMVSGETTPMTAPDDQQMTT